MKLAIFWIFCFHYLICSVWARNESCLEENLDMFIMLDSSRSLHDNQYHALKKFIAHLVKRFHIGKSRVGLMQFGDRFREVIEFDFGRHATAKAIEENIATLIHHKANTTHTGQALRVVNQEVFNGRNDRPDADKVLLLLTDGKPHDTELALREADELKRNKKVHFITIGAGSDAWIQKFKSELNLLGSKPTHNHRVKFKNFEKITNKLLDDICNKNRVQAAPPHKCFQEKQDILIMIDGSQTMGRRNFIKAKKLLQEFLSRLDIGPDRMHVGLIQYSDTHRSAIEFPLNMYKNAEDVLAGVSKVPYQNGRVADLGHALIMANLKVFSGRREDRVTAPDILVIFTDGNYINKSTVEESLFHLKNKQTRIVPIGVQGQKPMNQENIDLLATDPSDIYDIDSVTGEIMLDDLAPTTCKVVLCTSSAPVCVPENQDIIILIDGSSKIGKTSFRLTLRYLKRLVTQMTLGKEQTHVGIIQYGGPGFVKHEAKLGVHILRSAVATAISRINYKDDPRTSDLAGALKVASSKLLNPLQPNRKQFPKTIVIVSDGDMANFGEAFDIATTLRNKGVRVIALSSGKNSKDQKLISSLRLLATGPKEYYRFGKAYLNDILKEVQKTVCITENRIPETCFRQKRNLFFLLDSSVGRGKKKFKEVKHFMESIVTELHIGPKDSHVGFLQYNDDNADDVVFNTNASRNDVLWEITTMPYRKGKTITLGNALEIINEKVFLEARSQHPDYEDVLIILTHHNIIDGQKAFDQAELLKAKDVNIISIATTGKKKIAQGIKHSLQVISTRATSVHTVDYLKLWSINKDILSDICGLGKCPAFSATTCTPRKQDVVFVIDGSRSVGKFNFKRLQRFIERLASRLELAKDRSHVGVLQVGSARNTKFEFKLGEFADRDDVIFMIRDMEYLDDITTYIGHGLRTIRTRVFDNEVLDRPSVPNTLVIFTDGQSHDYQVMFDEAEKLKATGVRIISVGYGTDLRVKNERFIPNLIRLASNEKDVFVIDFDNNDLVLEERIESISKDLVQVDCPKAPAPPVVECRQGAIDLFLLVDGSRSITKQNFKLVKKFLKKLSSEFELGKNRTHLGLMQFSDKSSLSYEFGFMHYYNNKQAKRAIKRMKYSSGKKTYTGGALKDVDKYIFNGQDGDRPDAADVLILFTDGRAHDIRTAKYHAARLRGRQVKIIAIAAGKASSQNNAQKDKDYDTLIQQLNDITGDELEVYQSKFEELTDIVDKLVDVDCIIMPPKIPQKVQEK